MTEKGKNAEIGDLIRIRTAKEEIVGKLLESYEAGIVLVKLDSGYNMGVSRDNILDIKILKKAEKIEEQVKEFKISSKKPRIDLIITGGTLSSSLDVKTGGVKFLTSPERLFQFYPEIFEFCDVNVINPFMKWSENMNYEDWQKIAKLVVKSLNDENVKGVVVTHGTDFLHYTSSALSFMIKNINKPVCLTYAQRSGDRASSDAELNLICSCKMALSDAAEVMLIGHANMDDEYCFALQGNKVRKMHTSRRDTFKPINCLPIAKIFRDRIEILRKYNKRKNQKEMQGKKTELESFFEPKIALVKFYPGQNPEILEYYYKNGYKGIVVEFAGIGQVITEGNCNWIPKLKELIGRGLIVCAASQTIYGALDPLVYEAGRRLKDTGVIYLKDMLSETAFVKLGWVLGKLEEENAIRKIKTTKEQIEELMLENISGEFNERLGDEFLRE